MTNIHLSTIDLKDRRFSISYPLIDEKLRWSIETMGIIQPVILLDRTPLIPVTGIKRLLCARALRRRTVPALTINAGEDEALRIAIHDNIGRGLNIVEKALALSRMDSINIPREEIFRLMAHLGLNPHEKVLTGFLAIAGLDETLKNFIFTRNLSFKNIDSLLRFEDNDRKRIVRSLKNLHLTDSMLREILEMLHLLKIRKGRISAGDIPVLENADTLRTHLKKKTHPILSSLQKKLKAIRDAMVLPPGLDIKVDPFFEKEYIDILLKIGNEEDIGRALAVISDMAKAGHIRSILELAKGRIR